MSHKGTNGRVGWVDVAKGLCIILVVMMHSTLGVENALGATGWMHHIVVFAQPFRMPDFFLISGLFLAARIDRPWRSYLDTKVVHFAYFYVLWVTIQFVFKAPGIAMEDGVAAAAERYLLAFVQPFGTLWFIYLLPVFFVAAKLLRAVHWSLVLVVAGLLQAAPIHTGSVIVDEFAGRFVFFYAGYALAPQIFALAERVRAHKAMAVGALALWAPVNGVLAFAGWAQLPGIALALGFAGAGAIVAMAVLLTAVRPGAALRHAGAHSIVVYLAFFLPMAVTRLVLVKTGIVADVGTQALIVTAAAVIGPLVFHAVITRLGILGFLFERPDWARLTPRGGEPSEAGRPALA